ncbi:hypothetical protein [Alteromonas sp. CYL-A6]|uniref:hypothetical protein n=1 Tax=Alteromonas nitratireducens TaxID=3390813 RepID=UPI0034A7AE2C
MVWRTRALPQPVQTLITRALTLCKSLLAHSSHFYPFAAVYEEGKVGCLFTDDPSDEASPAQLIEKLQWRIIDTTTDSNSYSTLVYAATVYTQGDRQLDAIAVNVTAPDGSETRLIYPYFRVADTVMIAEPMEG